MSDFSRGETPHGRQPRLLEQVHEAIRLLHYSRRTEEAYVHWIRRFIFWSGKRHPATLGESEVTAFLSHLATERNVAAATQNQALAALLFSTSRSSAGSSPGLTIWCAPSDRCACRWC